MDTNAVTEVIDTVATNVSSGRNFYLAIGAVAATATIAVGYGLFRWFSSGKAEETVPATASPAASAV